jgi:hypothetical protein
VCRAHLARISVRALRRSLAATAIQSSGRCFVARVELARRRVRRAAMLIQAAARGLISRRVFLMARRAAAARALQRVARGFVGRRLAAEYTLAYRLLMHARTSGECAVCIGSAARGFMARRRVRSRSFASVRSPQSRSVHSAGGGGASQVRFVRRVAELEARRAELALPATAIAAVARGFVARMRALRKRSAPLPPHRSASPVCPRLHALARMASVRSSAHGARWDRARLAHHAAEVALLNCEGMR